MKENVTLGMVSEVPQAFTSNLLITVDINVGRSMRQNDLKASVGLQ